MSPGLALRQVGSRGSSAGGFRRAGLARREAGRTASRRARVAQAGPGARRSVSRRPTPSRSRPRTSCPGSRRPAGAAPVIPGRVPRHGDPPAAGRRHPLRRPPAVRGTATRQARGGGAVPGRVRSSGAGGWRPPVPRLAGAPRTSHESHAPHRNRGPGHSFNLPEGRLSESAAKAPIEPERRRRIVDIPRFFSRPIPVRGAFVADLDTPPPRTVPGASPAPPRARPSPPARRSGPTDRARGRRSKNPTAPESQYGRRRSGVRAHDRIRGIRPRKSGRRGPRRRDRRRPRPGPRHPSDRSHPGQPALAGTGLRNASPARRSPPRLAPCEPGAT